MVCPFAYGQGRAHYKLANAMSAESQLTKKGKHGRRVRGDVVNPIQRYVVEACNQDADEQKKSWVKKGGEGRKVRTKNEKQRVTDFEVEEEVSWPGHSRWQASRAMK